MAASSAAAASAVAVLFATIINSVPSGSAGAHAIVRARTFVGGPGRRRVRVSGARATDAGTVFAGFESSSGDEQPVAAVEAASDAPPPGRAPALNDIERYNGCRTR